MADSLRVAWFVPAALLLMAWPVSAQIRAGDLSTSLSGTVSTGYTADFGNATSSDHGWALGGDANLSGSFYSPNFLNFNAALYLNQSRANSNFQSISNASGVDVSTNIFGGSRFPGSVSYSKAYDSEGNYAVPGLANYVTHGDSDTFGINWSENLPNAPSFSAGFQMGSSQYSVYGTNDDGNNAFHSVNLHSSYRAAGFNMGAYYLLGDGHSLIPQTVAGEQVTETHSGNSGYGFNLSHQLPLQGSFSAGINRSEYDSDYLGASTNGTIDTINAVASVHPARKLSLSGSANYSDNLSGQLIQSVVAAGGVAPGLNTNEASNSLDLMAVAGYASEANLQASATAERRTQTFLGETYGVDSYGGSATYGHKLFDGNFNAALTVTANKADQGGEDTLGFSTNENYSSEIKGWQVSGSFGYAQNVQTLLVTYMNSFYNFSGNARRRWGRFSVGVGGSGARTALTQQAGTANSSQSYNASMGYGAWLTASGSYSRSSGQALATGAGLVPVPVPSPILPSNLVSLYGGDGYSFGVSSTPVNRLILTASYSNSNSSTSSGGAASTNRNDEFNTLIQYQLRKLSFNSGYSRLEQGFSGSGTPPEVISSFYIGVSRWFKFF
ncbi:MAG: hypothetical protein ABSD44_00785 [Terracidiphilus sp.]